MWAPWSGPSFCSLTVLFFPIVLQSHDLCLDVHLLFFPLLIHVFLFSGLLCAFSCGFLVTCGFSVIYESFFICSLSHLCIFSLTITHTSLQGSVIVYSCQSHPSAPLALGGAPALLWGWVVTGASGGEGGGLAYASPLLSYADHLAIYIARTEPQAPIKMVTLTIYCLKDKSWILCACGNYPQAAEGL